MFFKVLLDRRKKRPGYKYSKVKWFFHWISFFLFEKSLSLLMSIQTCFKGFKERWKPSLPEMNRKGWGFTWGKCNTVDSFFTRVLDSVIPTLCLKSTNREGWLFFLTVTSRLICRKYKRCFTINVMCFYGIYPHINSSDLKKEFTVYINIYKFNS